MKIKSLLLIASFCMNVQAADEMSVMKLKAMKRCEGCDLSGADLYYANLEGANLSGANLTKANLTNAKLRYANLFKTIMPWGEDDIGR